MKRYLASCAVALMLFSTPIIVVTGCKSPTIQQQAVNTLFTIHKAADLALNDYLDLVIAGKLSTNAVPKVTAAYDKFQTAFGAAVTVVAGNQSAPAPANVLETSVALSQAIATAKGQ